jgi:hypothetical protein
MIDPTRLYSALLNTGLQSRDNALYQVIHDLIGNLASISNQTNAIISGGGGSSSSIVNNTTIQLISEEDGQDGLLVIPGPQGIQGAQGVQGIPGMDGEDGENTIFLLR